MNQEILENVELLAKDFFSVSEIRIVLDLTIEDTKNSLFLDAYNSACLTSKSIINKGIVKLAKQGSGPAQTLSHKLYIQNKIDSIWNE